MLSVINAIFEKGYKQNFLQRDGTLKGRIFFSGHLFLNDQY